MLLTGAPASAQQFHMRAKLHPSRVATQPQSYTYKETFGPYGSCYNGTQSAQIVACTRSDGEVVENAKCQKQGDTRTCNTTCEGLAAKQWISGSGSTWTSGTVSNAQAAQTWCNANKPASFVGSCFWDSRDRRVFLTTAGTGFFNNDQLFGSMCR